MAGCARLHCSQDTQGGSDMRGEVRTGVIHIVVVTHHVDLNLNH